MLIGEHKAAFLEFLRNLTPQILFFTAALILGTKLDLTSPEYSLRGLKNAAPLVLCLTIFLAAFVANSLHFFERVVVSNEDLTVELQRVRARKLVGLPWLRASSAAIWRHNKVAIWNAVAAFLLVETGFVIVLVMAVPGAVSALRAVQP